MGRRTYEAISGFFLQDDPNFVDIPAVLPRFGLLDDSEDRWAKFFAHIECLNHNARKDTSYKVFFFGRHGQGYHNVGMEKHSQAWKDYWSRLNGDGEITWGPDPELTTCGEGQAVIVRDTWKTESRFGIPAPGGLYCSPLTRALQTCQITFEGTPSHRIGRPLVVENCREIYGVSTCDKRRTRTYIEATFPKFEIEHGLTEKDVLWDPDNREADAHIAERAKEVLDMIFDHDKETFISITAHKRIINGFLVSIGRQPCSLPTGGVIPIVVKSVHVEY